jgi:hypothetical protein
MKVKSIHRVALADFNILAKIFVAVNRPAKAAFLESLESLGRRLADLKILFLHYFAASANVDKKQEQWHK